VGATGLGLALLGLASLAAAEGLAVALLAAFLLGVGDGLVTASSHSIAATSSRGAAHGITRLNLLFALGAIVGPLWSGAALEITGGPSAVFAGAAAVAALPLALLLAIRGVAGAALDAGDGRGVVPQEPLVWAMSAVLFLYVGAEMGLGAWVSSYARRAAGAGLMASAGVTAAYWGALALGRFLTGALLGRGHRPAALLIGALAGAGCAALVLALSGGQMAVAGPAAFLTGLCFGPVWPVAVAIGATAQPGQAPAFMVTAGNAGGIVFPWAQGAVLSSAGPREGVAMTAAICAVMVALAGAATARWGPPGGRPSAGIRQRSRCDQRTRSARAKRR
jgi:fucose permease